MKSADAVTNSSGGVITLRDSTAEDANGKYRVPEVISWRDGINCFIGDLISNDRWSLLVGFIIDHYDSKLGMRSKCKRFSSITGYHKIEIGGFEYIERKKVITRRIIKQPIGA